MNRTRAFSLVELLVVVAILGILATTVSSLYTVYIRRAQSVEALEALPVITKGQMEYYLKTGSFISLGPTNIPPPPGSFNYVDFHSNSAWNWSKVNFSINREIRYGYRGYMSGDDYIVEAQGDLDGDSDVSIFNIRITTNNGAPSHTQIFYFDELE